MEGAMRRLARTVKPGGQIAISCFMETAFSPYSPAFLSLYEDFGKHVPPLSWKRLADASVIENVYREAGITDITLHHEPLGYALQSEQQWWDICLERRFPRAAQPVECKGACGIQRAAFGHDPHTVTQWGNLAGYQHHNRCGKKIIDLLRPTVPYILSS